MPKVLIRTLHEVEPFSIRFLLSLLIFMTSNAHSCLQTETEPMEHHSFPSKPSLAGLNAVP